MNLHENWLPYIGDEFDKSYMQSLRDFLVKEKQQRFHIYPPSKQTFAAFNATPFNQVKVVIIGQDPYHGAGQAHGLSFSVPKGQPVPPSLKNIYSCIEKDLGIKPPAHGFLESWATQGVFLLNATLSVRQSAAGSHQNKGWETFTDTVIQQLNDHREHLVFLLWGSYAQKKGAIINQEKHLVLKAPHPSPLSAHRGFFDCQHFSKTNAYLEAHKQTPIDWRVPD